MHFGPTPAQEALRGRARALLADLSPSFEVRRLMETEQGFDIDTEQLLAILGKHLAAHDVDELRRILREQRERRRFT